jgi:hypothetical protein
MDGRGEGEREVEGEGEGEVYLLAERQLALLQHLAQAPEARGPLPGHHLHMLLRRRGGGRGGGGEVKDVV